MGGGGTHRRLYQSQPLPLPLPRQLQQLAAPDVVPFLPPDPGSLVFLPPCAFDIECNPDLVGHCISVLL